jgi:hypothetical protein
MVSTEPITTPLDRRNEMLPAKICAVVFCPPWTFDFWPAGCSFPSNTLPIGLLAHGSLIEHLALAWVIPRAATSHSHSPFRDGDEKTPAPLSAWEQSHLALWRSWLGNRHIPHMLRRTVI